MNERFPVPLIARGSIEHGNGATLHPMLERRIAEYRARNPQNSVDQTAGAARVTMETAGIGSIVARAARTDDPLDDIDEE